MGGSKRIYVSKGQADEWNGVLTKSEVKGLDGFRAKMHQVFEEMAAFFEENATKREEKMLSVVVLAAGKGTRMKSPLPKVLHELANLTLIEAVLLHVAPLQAQQILVVGSVELFASPTWKTIQAAYQERGIPLQEVVQDQPLGTGHAVQTAFPFLDPLSDRVLICHADMPLVQPTSYRTLLTTQGGDLVVAATRLSAPESSSFGRLRLQNDQVVGIDEVKDSTPEQLQNPLANAAVYATTRAYLEDCLFTLSNQNASGEFYLTDIVQSAFQRGFRTAYVEIPEDEAFGINTRDDLLNAPVQAVLRRSLAQQGVIFQDANTAVLSMDTVLGEGSRIAPYTVFERGVVVGAQTTIHPFCVLSECTIEDGCSVGPFAHIKLQSRLDNQVTVGNFVEVKKSTLGEGTKAKHLSYLGDATLGQHVNVGAGTVTCNYDGFKKHPTVIEEDASIGANTALIAPVTVGKGAYIGAGSVITNDVSPGALALSRAPQIQKDGWQARRKEAHQKA